MLQPPRRGFLLILSSSSGTGKTTLARKLLAHEKERSIQEQHPYPSLVMSVSCTTRSRTASEVEGEDYCFLDERTFEACRSRGEFLEWAEVFGNLYATPHAPVREALARGQDMLFDVDWQGAKQITVQMDRLSVVSVFLLPPSRAVLEERLEKRRRDKPSTLALRMEKAAAEIAHAKDYDYIVVNDELEEAFRALKAILYAERRKRHRQRELDGFVASFSSFAAERL